MFSAFGLFLAALLCALSALVEGTRTRRLIRVGRETQARLIPGNVGPDDDETVEPPPLLKFQTEEGREVRVQETGKGRKTELGSEISILYDPNNPEMARRKSFADLWASALFWLALALLLAGLGLISQHFGESTAQTKNTFAPSGLKIVFIEQDA